MVIESTADIQSSVVVGAGEMGRGIAAVAALSGYNVTLQDIDPEQLEDAEDHIEWAYSRTVENGAAMEEEVDTALDRLSFAEDLSVAASGVDFAIEAAVEQLAVKQDIFTDLDEFVPADALLATNTSGLNITKIAEATSRLE